MRQRRIAMPFFPLLIACLVPWAGIARADDALPRVWINPGIYSRHFDRDKGFRENNTGIGVEVVVAPDHAVMAGTFINSENRRTRFLGYQWRPLHWQPGASVEVSAGVIAAALDGYRGVNEGGWFVAPLPVVAIEGRYLGVNLSVIPNIENRLHGAVALQFKLRVR